MKLNKDAKFKYNEICKVYGEQVLLVYESYIDARIDLMEGRVSDTSEAFNALKSIYTLDFSDLSDITAYAEYHIGCMIKENNTADLEFQAAKNPILLPAVFTSRAMAAMAESIGHVYEPVRHPENKKHKNGLRMWGKQIGPFFHTTNKGLVSMIWDTVQKTGDRNILFSATYSDGEKIFRK